MKKVIFLIVAAFILILPVLVFAQSDKEIEQAKSWLGQWKRNFASPSYGFALFHGRLGGGWYAQNPIPDEDRKFPITALDFRIFRGVNVSKRGGFYTGVETGVLFLQNFEEITFNEPTIGDMHLRYNGGLVYLMAKYGLGIDVGISLIGITLGAEMGMGGTLFAGGFDFYTGSKDDPDVEEGYGTDAASLSLVLDVAGMAALRLGKNFRLFAKAGIMAAPISVPARKGYEEYYYGYDQNTSSYGWFYAWDGTLITSEDDIKRAVMSQYEVRIDAFAIDMRVGFVLNFQ